MEAGSLPTLLHPDALQPILPSGPIVICVASYDSDWSYGWSYQGDEALNTPNVLSIPTFIWNQAMPVSE
ncbi:unnamed protein product [Peniophora sp. CBMAI 1063]|nr:unnamed protein product [Peniophora sp. CBMAI 1063]